METDEVIRVRATTCGPLLDANVSGDEEGPPCYYMDQKSRHCKHPTPRASRCALEEVRFVRKQEYLTWKLMK